MAWHHIFMPMTHNSAAHAVLLTSACFRRRSHIAWRTLPVGWSRTGCSYTHQRLMSCGVQQTGASTFYQRRHFQPTALWLTQWRQLVTLTLASMPTWVWELTYSEQYSAIDSPAHTARHVPDTGGGFSSVATGLWQRRTCRPTCLYLVRRRQLILNASARIFCYVAPTASPTCFPVYTGCASRSASSLISLCWRKKFFMELHRVTWVRSSVCLIYQVGVVSTLPGLIACMVVPSFKLSNIDSITFKSAATERFARGRYNVAIITHFS